MKKQLVGYVNGFEVYEDEVKEQKCIVKGCENHKHEGVFVGDLCKPCHQFITTGEGVYSQAYRNTHPVKEDAQYDRGFDDGCKHAKKIYEAEIEALKIKSADWEKWNKESRLV